MKNIKFTNHAIQQYESRTGNFATGTLFNLMNAVKIAKTVTADEAEKLGFVILKRFKGDVYLVWHDDTINEDLLGIATSDGSLKTVLTKKIYSWCNKNMKVRNEIEYRGRC